MGNPNKDVNYKLISEDEVSYLIEGIKDRTLSVSDARLILAGRLLSFKGFDAPIERAKAISMHRASIERCKQIRGLFWSIPQGSRRHRVTDKALRYAIELATRADLLVLLYSIPRQVRTTERLRIQQRTAADILGIHYNSVGASIKRLVKYGVFFTHNPSKLNHPNIVIRHGKAYSLLQ